MTFTIFKSAAAAPTSADTSSGADAGDLEAMCADLVQLLCFIVRGSLHLKTPATPAGRRGRSSSTRAARAQAAGANSPHALVARSVQQHMRQVFAFLEWFVRGPHAQQTRRQQDGTPVGAAEEGLSAIGLLLGDADFIKPACSQFGSRSSKARQVCSLALSVLKLGAMQTPPASQTTMLLCTAAGRAAAVSACEGWQCGISGSISSVCQLAEPGRVWSVLPALGCLAAT